MPSLRSDTRLARAGSWLVAHPWAAAALLYGVLSLVFAGQGLLPGRTLSGSDFLWRGAPWRGLRPPGIHPVGTNFELADATVVFEPFFDHTRSVLPHIPLWNPYIMGGRSYLGNAQSAVFSPFSWPMFALPVLKGLAVAAILKLWVGALGAWALGRAFGLRFWGALSAGLIYAFGTFFVVWLAWPLSNIFPLIPWMFVAADRTIARPSPGRGAALAVTVGLVWAGGHPETSFHATAVLLLFSAFRVLLALRRARGPVRSLLRPAVVLGLGLLGGIALAAVALLPVVELFLHSGDYAMRAGQSPSHADPSFLGAFLLYDYWGRPTQTDLAAFVSNRGYYAGGVTLMLAAAALLRPTAERIAWTVLGAGALLVVLGVQPGFGLVTALPGFKAAHNGRLVIYVLLALALLAGWGVDDLTARVRARRRGKVVPALALGIFLVPFAWLAAAGTVHASQLGAALKVAWGFAHPPLLPPDTQNPLDTTVAGIVRLSALLQWTVLAGAGVVLIALRTGAPGLRGRRLGPAAFGALVAVLLVADLFRANMGFNPAIPVSHARQPVTASIRALQAQRPNRFAGFDQNDGQPLQPDLAMRYGLYDARGYDYPVERRYNELWRAAIGPPGDFRPPTAIAEPTPRALRGLDLLSVNRIMQDPLDAPVHLAGLRPVYDRRDARLYANAGALPRAFVVSAQRTVPSGPAALRAVLAPAAGLRRVAVTEQPIPGLPTAAAAGSPGSARLTGYDDEHATVHAVTPRGGLLVLTDVFYPGWKATVDGRSEPIHRVDYLLRGVRLPPGAHTVRFAYEPASFRAGWIVSVLALLAIAGAALAGRGRARRPARDVRAAV